MWQYGTAKTICQVHGVGQDYVPADQGTVEWITHSVNQPWIDILINLIVLEKLCNISELEDGLINFLMVA